MWFYVYLLQLFSFKNTFINFLPNKTYLFYSKSVLYKLRPKGQPHLHNLIPF